MCFDCVNGVALADDAASFIFMFNDQSEAAKRLVCESVGNNFILHRNVEFLIVDHIGYHSSFLHASLFLATHLITVLVITRPIAQDLCLLWGGSM